MSPEEKKASFVAKLKTGAGVATALVAFAGGVWAFEDRYMTKTDAEQMVIQTVEQHDAKVQLQITDLRRENLMREYNRVMETYYSKKNLLKSNPGDTELLEELEVLKSRKDELASDLGL